MFNLFDRVPKINNWESESREIVPDQHFDATVEFDSIEFKYPSRPDASVLQNLLKFYYSYSESLKLNIQITS